jgi:glycosidase
LAAGTVALAAQALLPAAAATPAYRDRLAEDEIIYFVLPDRFDNADPANDRGGLSGDRLTTGFDPTSKGFYHGGDLKGLTRRLGYIQGLGASAIWVGPVFRNKPVQGAPGHESAGYHGYWITDFEHVDPHFGTDADFKALVEAAHARGLKVYMDIVVNHTADVIKYRECPANDCAYRDRATYPYSRRGGLNGAPINAGFAGDQVRTAANFAKLTRTDFAYTPYVPAGEEHAKSPDWLNDLHFYHNRGDSTYKGESSLFGDFSGLDDVATEDPRVVAGMIAIYGGWIDRFGIDGFRVDTAQHVNPEFWQAFVPAMMARARARGIPNFHIFGEVSTARDVDTARLARFTQVSGMDAVLDFAFQNAAVGVAAGVSGTSALARVYADDVLYHGGAGVALRQATFLGNHDDGRFAYRIGLARPGIGRDEWLKRVELGHALMLFGRGVPTLYAGDEQGFVGDGGDQDAREDMFGSQVASYNDNVLLGTGATTATPRFDSAHPLYRAIQAIAAVRRADPALRRGTTEVLLSGEKPGLLVLARRVPGSASVTIVAINSSSEPKQAAVVVPVTADRFESRIGPCAPTVAAPGSYSLSLPPLGYAVCAFTDRTKS